MLRTLLGSLPRVRHLEVYSLGREERTTPGEGDVRVQSPQVELGRRTAIQEYLMMNQNDIVPNLFLYNKSCTVNMM